MKNKIDFIIKRLTLDEDEKKLFSVFKSFKNDTSLTEKRILIQMPEDYYYLGLFSILIFSLKKKFNTKLSWIKVPCEFQRTGILRPLYKSSIFDRKWEKLYLAHGGEIILNNIIESENELRDYEELAFKESSKITSKKKLIEYSYKSVIVGDLVYDTYLRFKPAPTVDLKDPFLLRILANAFYLIDKNISLFSKNEFDYFITSYSTYIHHGIAVRCALLKKVTTISLGSYLQLLKQIPSQLPSHVKEYRDYKIKFCSLPEEVKANGISQARLILEDRFNGKIDQSTFYMKKSAYTKSGQHNKYLSNSSKPKFIFFLHCFFDSPHIYKQMIFPDFFEWIRQSLKHTAELDIETYVKPHPNAFNGNESIVNELLCEFPHVKVIPAEANNAILASEGFTAAVTVHGTLAHEFVYLGIPVICAGDNPHTAFHFTIQPKNDLEYFEMFKNVENIEEISEQQKLEVLEFIYMNSIFKDKGNFSNISMFYDLIKDLNSVVTASNLLEIVFNQERLPILITEFQHAFNSLDC